MKVSSQLKKSIEIFIQSSFLAYQECCEKFQCELNISYGESEREKLDIFGIDLTKESPLFVFVHGGYWQLYEKEVSGFPIKPLVEIGVKVMMVEYDLSPKVTLEEITRQIQRAGKFILNYCAENKTKKVSIAGHSAGAHLIAYLLQKDFMESVGEKFAFIKSMFFIAGIYDLKEARHVDAANENNLLSITDQNESYLSPIYHNYSHLSDKKINFHIYDGEFDSPIFKQNSEKFHETLKRYSVASNFEIYQGLDHFNIVEKLNEADYKMTKLIIEELSN